MIFLRTKPKKKRKNPPLLLSLSLSLSLLKDIFHCMSQKKIQISDSNSRVMLCSTFFSLAVFQFDHLCLKRLQRRSKPDFSKRYLRAFPESFLHYVLQMLCQNTMRQSEHSQSCGNSPDLMSNSDTVGKRCKLADW